MGFPQRPQLSNWHIFCQIELEHTKRFLGLIRHLTDMSKVALLVGVVAVMSLLSHSTFFSSPSSDVSFISVRHLVSVREIFETVQITCVYPVLMLISVHFTCIISNVLHVFAHIQC
jgi:hypothetical protein